MIENGEGVKKWKDRKYFNFPHLYLFGGWKSGGMEKISSYKFTHMPLLKNDAQLKQKMANNHIK